MRLPSHVLAKLALAGLTIGVGCEHAHEPECKPTVVVEEDSTPLDEVVRERPLVAPRYTQPKPVPVPTRPDPQPIVKKKPKPRLVWGSICGHAELVPEGAATVKCGKG